MSALIVLENVSEPTFRARVVSTEVVMEGTTGIKSFTRVTVLVPDI